LGLIDEAEVEDRKKYINNLKEALKTKIESNSINYNDSLTATLDLHRKLARNLIDGKLTHSYNL
jgi:hypothetical protein